MLRHLAVVPIDLTLCLSPCHQLHFTLPPNETERLMTIWYSGFEPLTENEGFGWPWIEDILPVPNSNQLFEMNVSPWQFAGYFEACILNHCLEMSNCLGWFGLTLKSLAWIERYKVKTHFIVRQLCYSRGHYE
jgi:hypothetical protein